MRVRTILIVWTTILLIAALSAQAGTKRALLIGINDYSASRLGNLRTGSLSARNVPNLDGTLNDVAVMRDLLVALHGFKPENVVTLTDQAATRTAVVSRLREHLLRPAQKNDVVYFYFSGHGSQVRNSRSTEADRLDESLVPADARLGAADIRDKELLPIFNAILDRGARLTVVFDACHTGSGARGLDGGLRHRSIPTDTRDVADPYRGPQPESRGALILSAAQDFDLAFEMRDENGAIRGAFTWALARAMRDAEAGESAAETFLRARARLQAERPAQHPVLAGSADARLRPLLGIRTDRRDNRPLIAVERVVSEGYVLQGGWASGVTVGSELRAPGHVDVRLEVTSLLGIARCIARVRRGTTPLKPGALLEIVTWAAPPAPPLRVWIPGAANDLLALVQSLRKEAARRKIRWVADPTVVTPTHLLRWRDGAWELVGRGIRTKPTGSLLAGVHPGSSLFVELPASTALTAALSGVPGIELCPSPESADYILAGRLGRHSVEFAWVRPFATIRDRGRSALPVRTAWVSPAQPSALRDALVGLRRVQSWHELRPPAAASSHYRLAIRRADEGTFVEDGRLIGSTRYRLVLRQRRHKPDGPLYPRYVYVFVIDSHGRSKLLFPAPENGSVENLLPATPTPGRPLRDAPPEISLTVSRPFIAGKPYGVDTFFLLSTDEPLPSLTALEWTSTRGPRSGAKRGPLEQLLTRTIGGARAGGESIRTPPTWSIDRVTFESVAPKRAARSAHSTERRATVSIRQ